MPPKKKKPAPKAKSARRADRVIPHLVVHDGAEAIDFYKDAFGAKEVERVNMPDGTLMHAELLIQGHRFFLSDEFDASQGGTLRAPRSLGGTSMRFQLEVADADAAAARAIASGAVSLMKVEDMFWGARYGKLRDPFGHEWAVNEQKRRLSPAAEKKAAAAYLKKR